MAHGKNFTKIKFKGRKRHSFRPPAYGFMSLAGLLLSLQAFQLPSFIASLPGYLFLGLFFECYGQQVSKHVDRLASTLWQLASGLCLQL